MSEAGPAALTQPGPDPFARRHLPPFCGANNVFVVRQPQRQSRRHRPATAPRFNATLLFCNAYIFSSWRIAVIKTWIIHHRRH